MAAFFEHECRAYCRDGRHTVLIWHIQESGTLPLSELMALNCARAGVTFVGVEEAREPGPTPVGQVGPWLDGEGGVESSIACPSNVIPYLMVWRESAVVR